MNPSERRLWEERYGNASPHIGGRHAGSIRPLSASSDEAAFRTSKYGNTKVDYDGYTFDSIAEWNRYKDLKLMVAAKEIRGLTVHPDFDLIVNGIKICRYVADFSYFDRRQARRVVEDVKSKPTRTRAYLIKKKLLRARCGIEIQEVLR